VLAHPCEQRACNVSLTHRAWCVSTGAKVLCLQAVRCVCVCVWSVQGGRGSDARWARSATGPGRQGGAGSGEHYTSGVRSKRSFTRSRVVSRVSRGTTDDRVSRLWTLYSLESRAGGPGAQPLVNSHGPHPVYSRGRGVEMESLGRHGVSTRGDCLATVSRCVLCVNNTIFHTGGRIEDAHKRALALKPLEIARVGPAMLRRAARWT